MARIARPIRANGTSRLGFALALAGQGQADQPGISLSRVSRATAVERQKGSRAAASQLGHSSEAVTNRHYIEQNIVAEDVSDVLAAFAN